MPLRLQWGLTLARPHQQGDLVPQRTGLCSKPVEYTSTLSGRAVAMLFCMIRCLVLRVTSYRTAYAKGRKTRRLQKSKNHVSVTYLHRRTGGLEAGAGRMKQDYVSKGTRPSRCAPNVSRQNHKWWVDIKKKAISEVKSQTTKGNGAMQVCSSQLAGGFWAGLRDHEGRCMSGAAHAGPPAYHR